jgi:cytoskeletal protein RodZ
MRRLALLIAAIVGLGFPAGLGLAVYLASGSTLAPPPVSARVPTGTIARPSAPPLTTTTTDDTTTDETTTDETTTTDDFTTTDETATDDTTTDETTTEAEDSSGHGRGRGRGRGRGGGDD